MCYITLREEGRSCSCLGQEIHFAAQHTLSSFIHPSFSHRSELTYILPWRTVKTSRSSSSSSHSPSSSSSTSSSAPPASKSPSRTATSSSPAAPAASVSLSPTAPHPKARDSIRLATGVDVSIFSADARDYAAVKKGIDSVGPIDVLVCNQGVFVAQELAEEDVEEIRFMIEVNLIGTFHLIKAALPSMKKDRQRASLLRLRSCLPRLARVRQLKNVWML